MVQISMLEDINIGVRRLEYCLAKDFRYPCESLSHVFPKTFANTAKVFRCACQSLSHIICCTTKFLSLYLLRVRNEPYGELR